MGQLDTRGAEKMKSIGHALGVLNEAAKDSSQEIKRMINKDYKRVKEAFADFQPEVRHALQEIRDASVDSLQQARDKITETARQTAAKVDEEAHNSPWYFMGGAALVAAIFGYMLGKKRT